MKAAEEYINPLIKAVCDKAAPSWIETIKQIQFDAYKAGMSEAAEIADKHYEDQNFNAMYRWAGYQINTAILSARDGKTSL